MGRRVAIFLGASLLVFAALMPIVLVPALKVIPLDAGGKTVTDDVPAVLLDARAFATNTPIPERADDPACTGEMPMRCFIHPATTVRGVRNVAAVEPSDKDVITLRAGNVLMRLDKEETEGLISASVDQVSLQRHSAFPVEEATSTFHMTAPDLGLDDTTGGFVRDGLQYQFPFNTEARSYPYFDTTAQESRPIDFVGTATVGGREVYEFSQDVGAVDMFRSISVALQRDGELSDSEKGVLAGLRMKSTAGRWYSPQELDAKGLQPEDPVVMTRYYAVRRTLLVEPHTGVIVRGQEDLHYFFASDEAEAQDMARAHFDDPEAPVSEYRSALVTSAAWNQDTQDRQFKKADEGAVKLAWLRRLTFIIGGVGVLLLVVGARRK